MPTGTIKDLPGGTIFHRTDVNGEYFLKAATPIISDNKTYHALSFETGKPAFTEKELDQEVDISDCVFKQI